MKNSAMPPTIPIPNQSTTVMVLLHVGLMFNRALVIHDADGHRVQRYIQSGVVRYLLTPSQVTTYDSMATSTWHSSFRLPVLSGSLVNCAQLAGPSRSSHANNRREAKREAVLFAWVPYA